MISHSPPIFSHSPPVSYFTNYMSDRRQNLNYNDDAHGGNSLNSLRSSGNSSNRTPHYCRSQMFALASKAMVSNAQRLRSASPVRSAGFNGSGGRSSHAGGMFACGLGRVVSSPNFITQPKSCLSRKSCLHKDDDLDESTDSRPRKHVIFADDEGHSLTEVRVMSEPSNVPPYWSMKFLEQITQGLVSPQPADQWTVDFKQPASDYLSFRQKIDTKFVSLENVIVRDEESIVVGTVKVKNISFEKEVIVRVTWDDWKSQQDIFCTFARAYGATTCAHVVFDTFSFKITLPPSSKRLEFCICFRAKDLEYWDNNDGKNYTITKRSPFYYNALSPYDKNSTRNSSQNALMSTLSEALAREKQASNGQQEEPSPYW